MRVGRAAIDEDAIRQLEQHNPEVQFDWTRILKQPVWEPPSRHQPRTSKPGRREHPTPIVREPARDIIPQPADSDAAPEDSPVEVFDEPVPVDELVVRTEADAVSMDELDTPAEADVRQPAAAARLGAEGLARLRARYAEVMARIAERPLDDEVREELKGRAERLNPDGWVTDDEVRQGLEQYETIFESLRSVIGHSRRRRRRRS